MGTVGVSISFRWILEVTRRFATGDVQKGFTEMGMGSYRA